MCSVEGRYTPIRRHYEIAMRPSLRKIPYKPKEDDWSKTVLERFSNTAVRDTIFRLNEDATNRIAGCSDESRLVQEASGAPSTRDSGSSFGSVLAPGQILQRFAMTPSMSRRHLRNPRVSYNKTNKSEIKCKIIQQFQRTLFTDIHSIKDPIGTR